MPGDSRLRWILSQRPGAIETVLTRSFGGSKTPYDWLARAVSSRAEKVLVVAAGSGGMVEQLRREGRFVLGLDWSESSIAEARKRGRDEFVQADANYLPFGPESFDAVVSDLGLAVNDNRGLMLAEVARVLRPGGMFAGLAPSMRPFNVEDFREVSRLARVMRVAPHVPGKTEFRMKALLARAGLQKAEDARAKFYFDVRHHDDAVQLIAGLRATEDAERAKHAIDYLTERAKRGTVRIPLAMRRVLAIK